MHDKEFPVVALCTSAGGVPALFAVLSPLPVDLPAAVVVLQHLAPEHPSVLPTLLQRRCALPVGAAADGDVLRPGQVLVVPPGMHMLGGTDERVRLIPAGPSLIPRPSADLLLATLAAALGPRIVAVILTGGGQDGAIGARAVAAFGGRVLVQDPESAFAPGMPSASASAAVAEPPLALADIAPRLMATVAALTPPAVPA
jgi:two-component system chemotaxis response regulator CheB